MKINPATSSYSVLHLAGSLFCHLSLTQSLHLTKKSNLLKANAKDEVAGTTTRFSGSSGIKKILTALYCLLTCPVALAYPYSNPSEPQGLGAIASNIFGAAMNIEKLVKGLCITTAAALLLGGLIQWKKYRQNPIETPLSKVVMSFLVAIALIILYFIPFQL